MKYCNRTGGQKIQAHIRRKLNLPLRCLLICGGMALIAAFILDLAQCLPNEVYVRLECWKKNSFYDTLIPVTTILAAAVIFYYSMQDYKKGGIPNRTILAYSFGSYAIPLYFFVILLLLPINSYAFDHNAKIVSLVCNAITYIYQFLIIFLIIISNSYAFSLNVICNAEIRQYKKLCDLETEQKDPIQFLYRYKDQNRELEKNPQFIWTYLMHHLEQVAKSEELIVDKMELVPCKV